jgi:hypothetical protein
VNAGLVIAGGLRKSISGGLPAVNLSGSEPTPESGPPAAAAAALPIAPTGIMQCVTSSADTPVAGTATSVGLKGMEGEGGRAAVTWRRIVPPGLRASGLYTEEFAQSLHLSTPATSLTLLHQPVMQGGHQTPAGVANTVTYTTSASFCSDSEKQGSAGKSTALVSDGNISAALHPCNPSYPPPAVPAGGAAGSVVASQPTATGKSRHGARICLLLQENQDAGGIGCGLVLSPRADGSSGMWIERDDYPEPSPAVPLSAAASTEATGALAASMGAGDSTDNAGTVYLVTCHVDFPQPLLFPRLASESS